MTVGFKFVFHMADPMGVKGFNSVLEVLDFGGMNDICRRVKSI